jgi:DNA adenine methylase
MDQIVIPKPIIKWVGGKTQIIDKILAEFPTDIHNYHETFLGGGSVLFALLAYIQEGIITIHGSVFAYDLNEPLIYMYKNIQSCHNELYDELQNIIHDYQSCDNNDVINRNPINIVEAKQTQENFYYWIRSQYNHMSELEKKTVVGSAMFIFLNKTGFRGMFRVGPNGFNIPFGHYKNPEIINKPHLDEIHCLIQGVVFACCDFTSSIPLVNSGDFVYMDPPYAPEKATSFVGYTENGFDMEKHKSLFELCDNLTADKKKLLMSNSDVELVRKQFTSDKYTIQSILCKRSINSKNPESKAKEVIIKNY